MKNYYDELQISQTASKEVIEKVYKVLAKKYHPDTTQETDKQAAEEKFKIISEAYEILSNDEKRKKYDLELENSTPSVSYEEYMNLVYQNDNLMHSINDLKTQLNNSNKNITNTQNTTINYNNNNNNLNTPPHYNNVNPQTKSKKRRYYNVVTGKNVSAFTYYCYKIKQFFHNLFIIILAIIAILLAINAFTNNSILNLL